MSKLSDYISSNVEFRSAVNLYLSLNKEEKIKSFIPTKSSVDILKQYLSAAAGNKRHATLLLGPYGKGKSHLLLVLLAILSMDRKNKNNIRLIKELADKISEIDKDAADEVQAVWKAGRYLPVIINGAHDDLGTPFLIGITDALKKAGLNDLVPDTYYSHALDCIERWKKDYPDTYANLESCLSDRGSSIKSIVKSLKAFDKETLSLFEELYSEITSGGAFNPLVSDDILPIYKSVSERLKEEYGYSGIYIIFDEFSKFIEGQDKKSAGNNMKILQDICELAADSKSARIYITMVAHKGIKEYGKYLSKEIINSFTGIEGRIEEIQFVTSTKNNYELIKNAIIKDNNVFSDKNVKEYLHGDYAAKSFDIPAFKSTFNTDDFMNIVYKGCYPLTPISAYLLLNVSEKVAQNERTLFTFISKEEQGSMATYIKNHREKDNWAVNSDLIYDYFKALFKKSVANEYVHNEWLNAEYAISQAKNDDERRVLKALALINIVNKPSELAAGSQIIDLASGVRDARAVILELEERELIYKRATDNAYVFKTRATSDARNEIAKRKAVRGSSVNYAGVLSSVSPKQYILPRKYNYRYAMTRYFSVSYMEVEEFLGIEDIRVILDCDDGPDGKVLYLYKLTEKDYTVEIEKHLKEKMENNLIVVYSDKICSVTDALASYDAITDLKSDVRFFAKEENKILKGELPLIEEEIQSEITRYLNEAFFENANSWIFRMCKKKLVKSNNRQIIDIVDDVAEEIYCKTVVVNNELINKRVISTAPIKKARLNIVNALLKKDVDVLKSYEKGTSADSTIYRALFVNNDIITGKMSARSSEKAFIDEIEQFISSCGNKKRCLAELINVLTDQPYGIRQGILAPFVAYCISKRDEDIIIYFSDKELPVSAETVVNMCENPADFSMYMSLEDAEKENYLKKLGNQFGVDVAKSNQEFRIAEVYSAMQRWFRGLPQVTKNIKKQDAYFGDMALAKSLGQIKSVLQAVDGNPYEAVFVEIPKAFDSDDLSYVAEKYELLHEKLSHYYDYVQQEIVSATKEILGSDPAQELRHCLRDWYEIQTESARNGLYSNTINDFMKLSSSNTYMDDALLAEKLSKIIIGVYYDSWNDRSIVEYREKLTDLKEEIEGIENDGNGRSETLIFTSRSGEKIEQKYDLVDEGTGSILKTILSDALDDFSDLPVNDRVAILLEMIEKTLGQER